MTLSLGRIFCIKS